MTNKMKTEMKEHKVLHLSADDVRELLPDEKFEYEMYWSYNDEISDKTLKEQMPDESKYKDENWVVNYENFIYDWKTNLEDLVREWNIDYITDYINTELADKVKKALKDKGIEYDEMEFDFYPDEMYSINLNMDEILRRSTVIWNVVWRNNFDGFSEEEKYEDWGAIEQFLRLNPWLSTKEDLECACADGIYSWSDLKVNIKSSMEDFFDILSKWKIDLGGMDAVLHLSINGSWSPDFKLKEWVVEFGKKLESNYDYWDWELDWHYWIREVYGCTMNEL